MRVSLTCLELDRIRQIYPYPVRFGSAVPIFHILPHTPLWYKTIMLVCIVPYLFTGATSLKMSVEGKSVCVSLVLLTNALRMEELRNLWNDARVDDSAYQYASCEPRLAIGSPAPLSGPKILDEARQVTS
jgi:hypothetical protein